MAEWLAKHRITLLFMACLLVSIVLILSLFTMNLRSCGKFAEQEVQPGVLELDQSENPYATNYILAGEWEYYPDQLLVSGESVNSLSGHEEGVNLEKALDKYDSDTSNTSSENDSDSSSQTVKEESTDKEADPSGKEDSDQVSVQDSEADPVIDPSWQLPNEEADHISIPNAFDQSSRLLSATSSKASYRMIIHGCRLMGTNTLMIFFPGHLTGNYKVYVNHQEKTMRMPTPWGYPIYTFDKEETVEIIIEVTNTTQILNVAPHLTSVDGSMSFYDQTKNSFLILVAALLTISIVFFAFILFIEDRHFYMYFSIGLIFSLYFALQMCWSSGYLDSLTEVLPYYSLTIISRMLLIFGMLLAAFTLHRQNPVFLGKKLLKTTGISLLILLLFQGAELFYAFPYAMTLGMDFFLLAVFLIWMLRTASLLEKMKVDQVFFVFGLLAAASGICINQVYQNFGLMLKMIYIMPACILLYILLMMLSVRQHQKQLLAHTRSLLALEKNSVKMQTAMLANQMKPHFLYNSLMTIQEMCYTEPENAALMIVHFSEYLRSNIDFMENEDLIPFTKEQRHIENYIILQKARFGDDLKFETVIDDRDFMIPPLSVQPLIENGIKYGIRKNADKGVLRLTVCKDEEALHILVYNSGPGFDPASIHNRHSIENIRIRLRTFLQGEVYIYSEDGREGTTVELYIPAEKIVREKKGEEQG